MHCCCCCCCYSGAKLWCWKTILEFGSVETSDSVYVVFVIIVVVIVITLEWNEVVFIIHHVLLYQNRRAGWFEQQQHHQVFVRCDQAALPRGADVESVIEPHPQFVRLLSSQAKVARLACCVWTNSVRHRCTVRRMCVIWVWKTTTSAILRSWITWRGCRCASSCCATIRLRSTPPPTAPPSPVAFLASNTLTPTNWSLSSSLILCVNLFVFHYCDF